MAFRIARGFFRLWLVLSVFWIAGAAAMIWSRLPAGEWWRDQNPGAPTAGFDVYGARKAGYSDAEIAAYLEQQNPKFDGAGARKAGYNDTEIIKFLTSLSDAEASKQGVSKLPQGYVLDKPAAAYRPAECDGKTDDQCSRILKAAGKKSFRRLRSAATWACYV
jgi:hypothetical protein